MQQESALMPEMTKRTLDFAAAKILFIIKLAVAVLEAAADPGVPRRLG